MSRKYHAYSTLLNTQYVVLFGNARDKGQFNPFARQIEPLNTTGLMEAYVDATSKPFSYMLVDLKSLTPNPLRYRSNSLPNNEQIVLCVCVCVCMGG